MRCLYLHIGQPKTASTFLQNDVFPRLSGLDVALLPRVSNYRNHDARRSGDGRLAEQITARSPILWTAHKAELEPALLGPGSSRSRLVSDEMFFGNFRGAAEVLPHLRAIVEMARSRFDAVRILCLIRRQSTRLMSGYVQRSDAKLKAGQADFEAFARSMCDPHDERYRRGMAWEYGDLAAGLLDLVGPAGLFMRPYEELRHDPRTFLEGLMSFLQQEPRSADALIETLLHEGRQANVRRLEQDLWQARRFNRLSEGISRLDLLREPLAYLRRKYTAPSQIRLRPEISEMILRSYEETNRRAARLLNIDLARYGYVPTGEPEAP